VVNASVPVQSADQSDVADTKQSVTAHVRLTQTGFEVAAKGLAQTEEELGPLRKVIGNAGAEPNYAALGDHLLAIKRKFPKSDTMILTPEPGIRYEVLIRTMDAARQRVVEVEGSRRMLKVFPTVVVSTVVQ
jgi:hypothetical protein